MKYVIGFCLLILLASCAKEPPVETKEALGEKLFFDKLLSVDESISCASCHKPEFAFADNLVLSQGVKGRLGERNTPSVMNMASRPYFFHDGRSPSLQAQAIVPIENPLEMDLPFAEAVKRIQEDHQYSVLFQKLYEAQPDGNNITDALAKFQISLESNGSAPHDQWMNGSNPNGLNASQQRGREIFIGDDSKCFECHFGPDFTGDEFRNIGLYDGVDLTDRGRFEVTKDSSDLGRFKVPGLRNVALTAPYMHNGMFQTLEEVIDYYSNPYDFIDTAINMDTLMVEPLNFTDQEKEDLVNFLHSLTDENIPGK